MPSDSPIFIINFNNFQAKDVKRCIKLETSNELIDVYNSSNITANGILLVIFLYNSAEEMRILLTYVVRFVGRTVELLLAFSG